MLLRPAAARRLSRPPPCRPTATPRAFRAWGRLYLLSPPRRRLASGPLRLRALRRGLAAASLLRLSPTRGPPVARRAPCGAPPPPPGLPAAAVALRLVWRLLTLLSATMAPLPVAELPGARVLCGVVCVCVPSFGVDTYRPTNTTCCGLPAIVTVCQPHCWLEGRLSCATQAQAVVALQDPSRTTPISQRQHPLPGLPCSGGHAEVSSGSSRQHMRPHSATGHFAALQMGDCV